MRVRTATLFACAVASALVLTPVSAAANTRAGDNTRFYAPTVALKSGLQRAPQGEDDSLIGEIPIWTIAGGVALLTLVVLALAGGSGSNDGGFQSNGAN